MNAEMFRTRGKELIEYIANYLENVETRRVFPLVDPGYLHKQIPNEAPILSESWDDIIQDVERIIMPGITHWQHPHFHAYFPGSGSCAAICGDILSGGLGCIGFTWASSPACTELEVVMIDWLAKALGLPDHFLSDSHTNGGGVIYHTCSEATLTSLFAARNKAIDEYILKYPDSNRYIILSKLVGYYSDQAHSSVERAGLFSMIQLRSVPTVKRRMMASTLRNMIQEDLDKGNIPFYCVATLGTTGSCVFDDLENIGPLCTEFNVWLHIDAAYAGSSFICPEYRHYLNGVEHAMSFTFNPHKWLLINFDCTAMWYKNTKYVTESFTVDPVYLQHKNQGKSPDFRHWHIPLGRRFRSLKIWFVLRLYGISGIQKFIRNHIRLAHLFESIISQDSRFEIVEEVTMGLVCFRLKGNNEINSRLYNEIERDGRIHIVKGHFKDTDTLFLRFALCYESADEDSVHFALKAILDACNTIGVEAIK